MCTVKGYDEASRRYSVAAAGLGSAPPTLIDNVKPEDLACAFPGVATTVLRREAQLGGTSGGHDSRSRQWWDRKPAPSDRSDMVLPAGSERSGPLTLTPDTLYGCLESFGVILTPGEEDTLTAALTEGGRCVPPDTMAHGTSVAEALSTHTM